MEWLEHTFTKYPELAVYLTLGIGYWIGGFQFRGFSLDCTGPAICRLYAATQLRARARESR